MSNVKIRSATEQDERAVVDVITLAFGGSGFAHGNVHLAEDGGAAAMWLPPGVESDAERLGALTEQYSPPERMPDMMQVFDQMAGYHPDEPCWFLPLIGVDPARQGRGYGSALLRHALDQCDRDNVAAYLESSNPRNIPLYERHGFKALGSIQAGSSPTIVPMLRRPNRQGR